MVQTSTATNSTSTDCDVIVIGGGPAGSSVATWLSQWGHRVTLLEKEHFPRQHVGESLLPGTIGLLLRLGILADVEEAGFVPKYGATYIWGTSREPWSISFSEAGRDAKSAFQVERSRFDHLLLNHSRASGVDVREGCRALDLEVSPEQVSRVRYVDESGSRGVITAGLCVDASGNSALLATRTRSREFNPRLRNIAVYGYFRNGKPLTELLTDPDPRDAGNIFIVAVDAGWIWYIPLGSGRYSVGLVTDARMSQEINAAGRKAYLLSAIADCPEVASLLRDAELDSDDIHTQSDWSYIAERFYGDGYLLVGDAACFVDPILSTGVSLALEGAYKAALAINTSFQNPKLTNRAMRWYDDEYRRTATNYTQLAEHWYHGHRSRDAWFWSARKLTDPSSNASIRQAFTLVAGGYESATPSSEDELTPFGGFGPFQLKEIYRNLDHAADEIASKSATSRQAGAQTFAPLISEDIGNVVPVLAPQYSFRPSMAVRGNLLTPVVKVSETIDRMQHDWLTLSNAFLPVLQAIDGDRSVAEIVSALWQSLGKAYPGDPQDIRSAAEMMIQDLLMRQIVVPRE